LKGFTMNKGMKIIPCILILAAVTAFFGTSVYAQKVLLSEERYIKPSAEIADLVTAPQHKNVTLNNLSPDGRHFLIMNGAGIPSLEVYAKPFVNLGEMEFDHAANRSRQFTLRRNVGFGLFNYETGGRVSVQVPKDASVSTPTWSPDGSKVSFLAHFDDATRLYVADVKTGKSKRLTKTPVLGTLITSLMWTRDGEHILTILVPDKRTPMPAVNDVAAEPKVRMTNEGKTPTRTYRFLLQTPHDMAMLEWIATGQVALINVDNGKVTKIGEPDMYSGIDISRDGQFIHVTTVQKPFSYTVPVRNFGTLETIFDREGKMVAEIQKIKLQTTTVERSDPEDDDKRNVVWRPDGRGLSYLQMEPGKKKSGEEAEPEEDEKRKDRVIQWLPPFDDASKKVLYESENSINSLVYSQDCETLFITEEEEGEEHLYAVEVNNTDRKYTIYKYKTDDVYSNPGRLMTRRRREWGNGCTPVIRQPFCLSFRNAVFQTGG
jgi:dipeptidyl aminopeptidase/acylaminoacyl peptidase